MKHLRSYVSLAGLIITVLLSCGLLPGCGDDNPTDAPGTGDYFPFSRNYVWTFRTNIFAGRGVPDTTFEMKIDTATHYNGPKSVFCWWYFIRVPAVSPQWAHFFTLLDSANTIYTWGDYPSTNTPPTPPGSLGWKHRYASSEGTRETITIQGKTYDAIRVDAVGEQNVKISWWFADGIGLIREYSDRGGSIFTDDYYGDPVEMKTELVSYTK